MLDGGSDVAVAVTVMITDCTETAGDDRANPAVSCPACSSSLQAPRADSARQTRLQTHSARHKQDPRLARPVVPAVSLAETRVSFIQIVAAIPPSHIS